MSKTDHVRLDFTLRFKTPFHCGTGLRENLIDRAVIKDSGDYLYIPGSHFKGGLRECCEQLERFFLPDSAKGRVYNPHTTDLSVMSEDTLVTRLFGSQYQPGRLFYHDIRQDEAQRTFFAGEDRGARAREGRYLELQTSIYTQVRIDRETRTAVKGALYTSEFGHRELSFQGRINGWIGCEMVKPGLHACFDLDERSAPTYSLLLLLAGLLWIDRLGANRSTGKGECQCEIEQLRLNNVICEAERWRGWLEHLEALEHNPTIPQGEEAS